MRTHIATSAAQMTALLLMLSACSRAPEPSPKVTDVPTGPKPAVLLMAGETPMPPPPPPSATGGTAVEPTPPTTPEEEGEAPNLDAASMNLVMDACFNFADAHNGKFPADLNDLVRHNFIKKLPKIPAGKKLVLRHNPSRLVLISDK